MISWTQTCTYLRSSAVHESADGRSLALETSGGATPAGAAVNPRFFSGFPTAPVPSAVALLAVADVAGILAATLALAPEQRRPEALSAVRVLADRVQPDRRRPTRHFLDVLAV
ncbi:hypothetical protein [Saccharothrix sp. ALI-22-I]|uniref:hypothetical protein n=1 Tax=Saccharothrix sp. ALI-22-I TaxID=1933778 RepID=UPI0015C34400|nr:hypothetical protein [Saccharothrix sp. ALI-22-I]